MKEPVTLGLAQQAASVLQPYCRSRLRLPEIRNRFRMRDPEIGRICLTLLGELRTGGVAERLYVESPAHQITAQLHLKGTRRASRGIADHHAHTLSHDSQRGLNPLGLRMVFRVQHSTDHGLAAVHTAGQLTVRNTMSAHRQIERHSRSQMQRHVDPVAGFDVLCRRGDILAKRHPAGQGLFQAVGCLSQCFGHIFAVGQGFRQVRESDNHRYRDSHVSRQRGSSGETYAS